MTTLLTHADVAKRIAETALLRGEFTLRSGRKSSYYLDKYLFSTQPDILAALGHLFTERLPDGITRLAGAELGGIPLVSSASMASGDSVRLHSQSEEGLRHRQAARGPARRK